MKSQFILYINYVLNLINKYSAKRKKYFFNKLYNVYIYVIRKIVKNQLFRTKYVPLTKKHIKFEFGFEKFYD